MKLVYYFLQWTWGFVQNLVGLIMMIILKIKNTDRKIGMFHWAVRVDWKSEYSMAMGMFIFFGHADSPDGSEILVHEFGHTIQSAILGPLYLPLVGLSSLLWSRLPKYKKKRAEGKCFYYDFLPERSANACGERVLHEKAPSGSSAKAGMRKAEKNDTENKKTRG